MPRLSEAARQLVIPDGVVTTGWPAVRQRAREFGVTFDDWQDGAGRIILGKRADGRYAATVGGVVMSIPRQVGKTFLVAVIVVSMCTLFPGLTVIWTAHRTRTTSKTFGTVEGLCRRRGVRPYLAPVNPIRRANGEQEVRFANGSRIMFGAREQGFGRGFDAVDIEVFDEAQILTEKALEDMVAATNAAHHPHGALLLFMGTPPRPIDPGAVFSAKRAEALSGDSRDTVYIEFSADPQGDPDDPEQWALANPGYPARTPHESMLRLRQNLPSLEGWLREGLGIWDATSSPRIIPEDIWTSLADPTSRIDPRSEIAYAIDRDPDQRATTIAIAGQRSDGYPHVEVIKHVAGDPAWVIPWLEERCITGGRRVRAVVIDVASPAKALTQELKAGGYVLRGERRIRVTAPRVSQVGDACAQFLDAALADRVVHIGQPGLSIAVDVARKRPIGTAGQWAWDRKAPESDITPLVAVTNALWGLTSPSVVRPYTSVTRATRKAGGRKTRGR